MINICRRVEIFNDKEYLKEMRESRGRRKRRKRRDKSASEDADADRPRSLGKVRIVRILLRCVLSVTEGGV